MTSAIEKGKELITNLEHSGNAKKAEEYQTLINKVESAKDFIELLAKIDISQPNEAIREQAKAMGYVIKIELTLMILNCNVT